MLMCRPAVAMASMMAIIYPTQSFILPVRQSIAATATQSSSSSLFMSEKLSLTLDKPLGLILEEDESSGAGVIVTQVNEGGSAYTSPSKDALVQSKISTVNGIDVSTLSFDDVMDVIINADATVQIEFVLPSSSSGDDGSVAEDGTVVDDTPKYEVGTEVTILVQQPSETNKGDITLNAKVGDNLRKTLLANGDIELYRGLKKKLGNCGGGGQCGYCAVELVDDDGVWGERSEYEANKIGKNGNEKCRLACMNNIVGPCTIKTL